MIGLILVTHGKIGFEMLEALNGIVGFQEQAAAISIGIQDDMEKCRDSIMTAIKDVNSGDGVILLTDMFGGTPSNLAISVMEQTKAEVIAGLNLPMLIKLASLRSREPLDVCVGHAQEAGRKYISVASYVLAGEK